MEPSKMDYELTVMIDFFDWNTTSPSPVEISFFVNWNAHKMEALKTLQAA